MLLASTVFAQRVEMANGDKTFYGGLVFGANFSTVEGDNYGGFHKVGINGGATVYVKLLGSFYGNVEILYSQKGSRGVKTVSSIYTGQGVERYFLDLNYVEIPLIINYFYNDKWHGGLGVSYSQLINSKEDAYAAQPVYLKEDPSSFKSSDMNLLLNLGYQFGRSLYLNARYGYSLSTIRDPQRVPVGFGNGSNQFNSLFSLRLMYLFP
ncbi:MAG: outer membrane beta-barrel protein [Flavipsychrobacter sp.]